MFSLLYIFVSYCSKTSLREAKFRGLVVLSFIHTSPFQIYSNIATSLKIIINVLFTYIRTHKICDHKCDIYSACIMGPVIYFCSIRTCFYWKSIWAPYTGSETSWRTVPDHKTSAKNKSKSRRCLTPIYSNLSTDQQTYM